MPKDKKSGLDMSYGELLENASVHTPSDAEKSTHLTDEEFKKMSSDAKKGQFDFINVSVIGLFILILGVSFALLRDTGSAQQSAVKPSVMGFADGSYAQYLSRSYENALPGKSVLADINGIFASIYGAKSYNSHNNFLEPVDANGNIINTLTAVNTTTTTTTLYTGKTSNTTKKVDPNGIYIGPQSNMWTTTTTKKTKSESTEEETTEEEITEEITEEPEETQATTTVKIDLEDAIFTKTDKGMIISDFVIEPAYDITDYNKVVLSYEFFGETSSYFIRPYIEQDGKNTGENVNPLKDTVEFDVSRMTGEIKVGIRLIARTNSGLEEGSVVNVKLHYGLAFGS